MENNGMSGSDALSTMAAIDSNRGYNNGGFFGGMDGAFWIFALLFLNNNGWGNGFGMNPGFVTQADLAASQNAQTNTLMLNGIQDSISQQTNTILQQNSTNLINAIQGFNQVSNQITNQTNVLSQQIQSLGAQLNQCCCDIKTQMLQNRLTDAEATIVAQRAEISNQQQTQTILNQLGRFVAWAGSGTPAQATGG